ncbi:hypothetical protein GN156_02850 [bacterium LRH843]|nr:hypothetical protein [bacterium LRH843]
MKKILLFTLCLFVFLTACGQGTNKQVQGEEGSGSVADNHWLFETEAKQDEDILHVTLTVTNEQDDESSLEFTSGQLYEMILTNDHGDEVYRYSSNRMFIMMLTQQLFSPGETKTFEEDIPLAELSAGNYKLHTELIVKGVDGEEWKNAAVFQNEVEIMLG